MEIVIKTFDEMAGKGLIEDYVLGGATALVYYSAPTFTEDIDIFITLKSSSRLILDLSPVYEFLLHEKGCQQAGEYVYIGGFPVQILAPYDSLSTEAFENPREIPFGELKVKIFQLEYIMAIMIQLGKNKYLPRLSILLEERDFEEDTLNAILERHALTRKWNQLQEKLK